MNFWQRIMSFFKKQEVNQNQPVSQPLNPIQATPVPAIGKETIVDVSKPIPEGVLTQAPPIKSEYPKWVKTADGGLYLAQSKEDEDAHALLTAETIKKNQADADAQAKLATYNVVDSVIPVPTESDPYVVWAKNQNPNSDPIGAVVYFNSLTTEEAKWVFANQPGNQWLTNYIQLFFTRASVSPYINKWEQEHKDMTRSKFFPV